MRHGFWAGFLSFIVLICLLLFFFLFEVLTLTSPKSLKTILNQSDFYRQAPALLISLTEQVSAQSNTQLTSFLTTQVVLKSIQPETIKRETEKFIDSFFPYIRGESDKLPASVDLTALKKELSQNLTKTAPDAVTTEYNKLPICNASQLNALRQCQTSGNCDSASISLCRDPSIDPAAIIAGMNQSNLASSFLQDIPNTLDLGSFFENHAYQIEKIRNAFKIIKLLYLLSLVFGILAVLIIFLLAGTKFRYSLSRVGWTILVPGFLLLAVSLIGRYSSLILNLINLPFDISLKQSLLPLIEAANKVIFTPAILISGLFFFVGLIMVIVSRFFPRAESNQTA